MNTLIDQALQGGKYTLDKEFNQNGSCITFQATHQYLGQTVLIKTLNEAAQQAPNFAKHQRTFQAKVQRLAMCVHPNIVKIHDFFVEDDLPYIVMDCISAQTLHDIVVPDRPLPETIAIRYIRQIGEALKVIHQNGLLHQDITPKHIGLHPKTQEAVLIDFGLACEFVSDPNEPETLLISSGGYAPIEQHLAQDKLKPATDVYGLAATLYTLLTAKTPVTSILREHQPLPSPRHLRPELSPAVDQAVMSGMALECCNRPSTIAEWLSLLPNVEAAHHPTPSLTTRSVEAPLPQAAASRPRARSWIKGNQRTPQLMTGIVPTTGFDRRWLTSGAMVFGVVLTLVATTGLLLKLYSPKQIAPLPATSPTEEGGGIPFWQELGIPALKQQPPTSTDPSVPNTTVPETSVNVLEDPFSQPLQPLIDEAPSAELLPEEFAPFPTDSNSASSEASPAKTAPKILDEWESPSSPTVEEPTPELPSQAVEDSALPTAEDLNVDSSPSAEEAPTPDPSSTLLRAPISPQEILLENPEVSPEDLEISPENPEVLPESSEISPENPE